MATKEGKRWWDPYETTNRRQFIYRPNSAAELLLCPTSTSFIDSYSQSGPFGSTVYSKDFCWKPACKPDSIRTGTTSGQRRNNPHPSQSFMMWRLPREYVSFQCRPSEGEIRRTMTAQYSSIYRCDYTGTPQGHNDKAERRCAPLCRRREMLLSTDTEMRDNYQRPKQKPELLANYCSTDPNEARCGIVPTVVQRHTQQKRSDLTNYDRFYGKRVANVERVIKSLLPQELQQLQQFLPDEGFKKSMMRDFGQSEVGCSFNDRTHQLRSNEKEAIKAVLSKDAYSNNREKVNKLPAVMRHPRSPEWISSWPGPL